MYRETFLVCVSWEIGVCVEQLQIVDEKGGRSLFLLTSHFEMHILEASCGV
jgi:hypothetical protein